MIHRRHKELFELLKYQGKERRKKPRPFRESSMPGRAAEARSVVSLRQETCIFGGIILILLLIVTFILGYYKGRSDMTSPDYGVPEEVKRLAARDGSPAVLPPDAPPSPDASVPPLRGVIVGTAARPTAPPSAQRPVAAAMKYTLRVWTGSRGATGKAADVLKFFKSKGFDATSRTDREGIKIFVGRFKSRSDPEAVRTRNQVRELIYRGSRSFQDCYFVTAEE